MIVPAILTVAAFAMSNDMYYGFIQFGRMRIDDAAERSASLQVECSVHAGGTLFIELIATEANTWEDFDYDDFKGPDAPAGGAALSRLAWKTAATSTEITHSAVGSYSHSLPETFGFAFGGLQPGEPAKLLASIGVEAGVLTWTQTGFDNPKRHLFARFELDTAAAKRLHDYVSPCLPAAPPAKQ
jgi:hypothetical protein